MRVDELGNQCPATLGEYRDICAAMGGEDCPAVKYLDKRIVINPFHRDISCSGRFTNANITNANAGGEITWDCH